MNTSNLHTQLAALAARIESELPGADVDVAIFPSGGAMIDVRRDGRLYVLSYSPSRGYGVDEVRDGEGFQLAYRYAYDAFEPAADKLAELASSRPNAPRDQAAATSE